MKIQIEDLSYFYHETHLALDCVSLNIQEGEKVALVGPNGAGKTTLLLHLNGILQGKGKIRIDGEELQEKNLRAIRAKVGMVFQLPDDQLFSATVYDDVAFGLIYQGLKNGAIEHRVRESLKVVGMEGSEQRAPYHLSLGEKKRVALATVLSMQPQILAIDEPTAGLDPGGRRSLINLLKDLSQTIIVATHDLALVKELFPRLVIMDGGRVEFDGNCSDALADQALLRKHSLEQG